jgi:CheY-like chemotaxis protein
MPHILLIDGDRERRSLVARHLDGVPGVELAQADADIAAVRRATETNPNLVLMGLDDPDSWLLSLLKGNLKGTPLIAYTTTWQHALESRAMQKGANYLLGATDSRATYLATIVEALRNAA